MFGIFILKSSFALYSEDVSLAIWQIHVSLQTGSEPSDSSRIHTTLFLKKCTFLRQRKFVLEPPRNFSGTFPSILPLHFYLRYVQPPPPHPLQSHSLAVETIEKFLQKEKGNEGKKTISLSCAAVTAPALPPTLFFSSEIWEEESTAHHEENKE